MTNLAEPMTEQRRPFFLESRAEGAGPDVPQFAHQREFPVDSNLCGRGFKEGAIKLTAQSVLSLGRMPDASHSLPC